MPIGVVFAVLAAALFHAIWNALIKKGKDPLLESMLLSVVWIIICLSLIPFLPFPDIESWPYAVAAVFIHLGYFLLLSKSYSMGDFGAVYPVVRGLPPFIVTLVGVLIINEPMSYWGAGGVALIGAGILVLGVGSKGGLNKLMFFAVATAMMIASYTVVDGLGARLSGHSTSFFVWFTLPQSVLFIGVVFYLRGKVRCVEHIRKKWRIGMVSGLMSFSAYSIVLWAITKAPIAYVSALRETSVLFASIIAIVFLGEPVRKTRIVSAVLIFAGILMM